MKSGLLVENCFALDTASITDALARIRNQEEVSGSVNIAKEGDGRIELLYYAEYAGTDGNILVSHGELLYRMIR